MRQPIGRRSSSISWAARIKRTACGRSCASASPKTWPSAARCSSWRAFWRSPTPRGSAGGPWNGGGTSRSVPRIKAFDAAMRSRTGKAASARNWFGYAAVRTLAQIANQEKSLDRRRARPRAAGIHVARRHRARSQPRLFPRSRPRADEHDFRRRSASAARRSVRRLHRACCRQRRGGGGAGARRARAGSHFRAESPRCLRKAAPAGRAGSEPCDRRSDRPAD